MILNHRPHNGIVNSIVLVSNSISELHNASCVLNLNEWIPSHYSKNTFTDNF